MAAFALVIALAAAALSLDAGRLWLERRTTQRAADMAAIAASRFIGCGTYDADGLAAAQEMARQNGIDPTTVQLTYGKLSTAADGTSTFTAGGSSETADAVQVSLSKSVPNSLMGAASGNMIVPATATAKGNSPVASFAINSVYGVNQSLATATSGLFGAILGTNGLNLTPASLQSLLSESVTLNALMKAAGLSTVEQLLDQGYTLSTMLKLFAIADPNLAGNAAFTQIATAAAARPNLQLSLSQVLSVYRPVSAGVKDAKLNMLDLILTGVQVGGFNGGGLFSFSSSGIFVFGIQMFNAPKLAVGPAGAARNGQWCTTSQSSQFSIKVGVNLSWLLGLADFVIRLDNSSVEGHLKSLSVNPGNIQGVVNSQTSAVTVVLTNSKDVNKPLFPQSNFGPATILGGLFGLKLYQQFLAGAPIDKTFTATSKSDLPTQIQLGAGSLGQSIAGLLGNQSNIEVSVLFGLIKLRVDFLDDLVTWVMTPLGNLLDGLLALFGIQTGSVYLQLRTVDVMPPTLVR